MKINVGLLNLLTIVFVILKLVGVITWSWWLILLPTIIWWLNILVSFILFISFMLSLINRLIKKVKAEINNKNNGAEDLFKKIEKDLRGKGK